MNFDVLYNIETETAMNMTLVGPNEISTVVQHLHDFAGSRDVNLIQISKSFQTSLTILECKLFLCFT